MRNSEEENMFNVRTVNPFVAAALLAASLASVSAHAEGAYVGANVGASRYSHSVDDVSGTGSSVTGKVYGGYQFNPYFALETGFADLGRQHDDVGRADGHAFYLDAVGLAPLNQSWSLLGSVGIARAKFDTTNGDGVGDGLKLGVGAQYALSSHVALRGEMERYQPNVFGSQPDINQYTVGLRWAF
jgi:OOP family OmpA-OmpF porin